MGRNILSICDECKVSIFHLRGKESDFMQQFQEDHIKHEKKTRIVSDYVEEEPEGYKDVTESYNAKATCDYELCKNKRSSHSSYCAFHLDPKHEHDFHLVSYRDNTDQIPSTLFGIAISEYKWQGAALFICECGKYKEVQYKEAR